MGTTYTRQESASITDGSVIEASHFNNEFNQVEAAFAASTGHQHDGTTGEGGYIPLIADTDANNKIVSDTVNNRFGVFVEVASSPVEQFRFQDGAIVPVTDNDIDLGTSVLEFKDLYLDGTANVDTLVIGTSTGVTSVDTDLTTVSASDDTLASAKAIKTYIDAQVTAQDLDFQADTGGALSIDLDSESLTFTGGTGIDTSGSGNAVTFAIDSTVATLTGSQTLTNKTIDVDNNTVSNIEVDNFKAGVLDTDLTTVAATDTTLASAKAIKAYVDSQVTAQDLDFQGDTGGALSIDLDSETLTIAGGTGIDTSGSLNTLTVAIDSTVATLTGTQTLTNKTLTSPVLNTSVSGTAFLDDDTFATATATTLASSESIKAYVDASVATANELSELTDVNITTPADGALLFYDTLTSKWIDNVVSGDITIADTGIAAIGTGVIVNADINASAAIDATKIHDGSVTNTEFGYIGGLTSDAQTQINTKLANVVEDTTPQLGGTLDTNGNPIQFGDNIKAQFGASQDLEIYHDGTQSIIADVGTGQLQILAENTWYAGSATGSNVYFKAVKSGAFEAYHSNSKKLETTATGIQTTGTVNVNGAYSLPTADGTSGQVLSTDGVGNVSFTSVAGGASEGFAVAMAIAL